MLLNSCQEEEHHVITGPQLFFSKLSPCPPDSFLVDIVTLQTPTFTPTARPIYRATARVHWTAQHSFQPLLTLQNNNGVHPSSIQVNLKLVNAV